MHLRILKRHFQAEGLDISLDFLRLAKKANPGTHFHKGDMRTFALGRRFDLITCMFSSIGYMKTMKDIKAAIRNMAAHLTEGGVLMVEPWLSPGQWHPGRVSMSIVNEPELKIVRMNTTERKGRIASFEMHYLVGKPEGVFHSKELHQTRLSTVQEMTNAFREAGLDVEYDKRGPTGRGLYIAKARSAKGRPATNPSRAGLRVRQQ
jgi:SAM-dependent methyltransferase